MVRPQREETQAALLNISIGGTDMFSMEKGEVTSDKRAINLKELVVEQKLDSPDYFRIRYVAQELGKRIDLAAMKQGAEVGIHIGYDEAKPLFTGEVSYINAGFGSKLDSSVEIGGFDKLHRLTRGKESRTWGDAHMIPADHASVLEEVITQSGPTEAAGDDGLAFSMEAEQSRSEAYLPQYNENNYQFIRRLGADDNQPFDMNSSTDPSTITYGKPEEPPSPFLTVCFDKVADDQSIRGERINFRASTVRQVSKVVVRGWDPNKKKTIIGTAQQPSVSYGVTAGHEVAGQAYWGATNAGKVHIINDHPVFSVEEASALAQSVFDQLSMDFVTGDCEILGTPELRPGMFVGFRGYGDQFDGTYLVTEVSHVFMPGIINYQTTFSFARNGANGMVDEVASGAGGKSVVA